MSTQKSDEEKDTLVSAIEKAGTKAFHPDGDQASRTEGQREFGALISRAGTSALISTLNALIKPDRVPAWLRIRLMDVLTLLPQRPDGVRATLEFVFSVHPSSTVKTSEAADPQKQGANITMEALKMASHLLSNPPTSVSPEKWFPGIAPQLLALLDGNDGPDLAKVAAYVIGFGILGRKQFGAPGSRGWKAFAEPMLARIDPSLSSEKLDSELVVFSAGPDEVIDFRKEIVLIRPDGLSTALRRLSSLLNSHPNPGLTKRLLAPLLLPLWALASWPSADGQLNEHYGRPAKALLEIYLKLTGSVENFRCLLEHLLFNGNRNPSGVQWANEETGNHVIQIKRVRGGTLPVTEDLSLAVVESKTDAFIGLLRSLASNSDISTLFLDLFQESSGTLKAAEEVRIAVEDELQAKDPMVQLFKAKVLQKMLESLPDRLISDPKSILQLVSKILGGLQASETGDDATAAVALSLLNLVVTAPSFQKSDMDGSVLASIETSLARISKGQDPETSQTAHNLSLLLEYRDAMDDPSERPSAPTGRQVEDRKTYQLAISYITQVDSPAPVRFEGLNLLSTLIKSNSSILDIPATLVLLSSLLNEEDDYINLRVMKLFTEMADKHPKSTTNEILEHYVDANEDERIDTRLRFGETLLQTIQRLGETFSGEPALSIGEALLAIAGRRAHRPKTEAKRDRAERIAARKHEAAQKAWAGELPDLSEGTELTEEEKARNEILSQIVSGWESKRGAEDIRIRASSLSVFAVGMETNVGGFGPTLVEAGVDLCVNILTLESGPETAILRRAAIILILTFVRALADAQENNRRLGFGLPDASRENIMRILEYIAQTDNDELVQQHARDVVESLENWQMTALIPEVRMDDGPAITRLAGLHIGGGRSTLPSLSLTGQSGGGQTTRPRIEEIE